MTGKLKGIAEVNVQFGYGLAKGGRKMKKKKVRGRAAIQMQRKAAAIDSGARCDLESRQIALVPSIIISREPNGTAGGAGLANML